ncbi:AraC family transcriptional regulator [bacterium]|nr:AraC family transcriptional regulator [bacterium]
MSDIVSITIITISNTICSRKYSGFDNSSYFTRKFKQVMEITPAEYLKSQKAI